MAVTVSQLFSTPEYRRHLIQLIGAQLVCFLLFSLFTGYLLHRIDRELDDRIYAAASRLQEAYPGGEDRLVSLITRSPGAEEIERGRVLMAPYGYTGSLALFRKPLFRDLLFPAGGGLLLLLLAGTAVHLLVFHIRQRELFEKIAGLSECIMDLLEGRLRYGASGLDEGLWALLIHRFNQMVKQMMTGAERLDRDKLFLKNTLSDISHQLKTPMASLILYNDLMTGSPAMETDTRMDFLERCGSQLRRMEWLVKSLLKLARLEAGTIVYKQDTVLLTDPVNRALEGLKPLTGSRTVTVSDTSGGTAAVTGDTLWLCEAFTNILRNAFQHTREDGTVKITLSRTPLFVRLSVRDDGGGIPAEDLPRIFERFYRGSCSPGMESVGIGLSLSRMIVRGHGGDIRVNSEEGAGSDFLISFPD